MSAKITLPDKILLSIEKQITIIMWNAFCCYMPTKRTWVDDLCSCYKRIIYMLTYKVYCYYVLKRLSVLKNCVPELSQIC